MSPRADHLPWVAARKGEHLTLHDLFVEIEFQESCCCFTFRGKRLDHDASDRKVILPTFTPRMKEANKFAGASVQGPDVTTLPYIASQASVGQIVRR